MNPIWSRTRTFSVSFATGLSALLLVGTTLTALSYTDPDDPTGNFDEYSRYSEQASQLFNSGQLTQSIEAYEKALATAPDSALSTVYNNLATVYIRRGNYFHDKLRQDENALNDYRKGYFYLELAWPEGMERKRLHDDNRKVARENMSVGYHNLKINPADKSKHLELARQLRLQGKFPEAIVEYAYALELDRNDTVAAKALGDLFTVVNLPEKSKKYYAAAVGSSVPSQKGVANDETLVQLGNAQYKTGEVDKAIANFDKALAINPGNVSALNMLEKIWANEIKFNPTSVLGHANLGGILQKKKLYHQAMEQYKAAEYFAERDRQTSFDTKKLIRLNIGTLYQEDRQYQMALSAYETVLQAEPNHLLANYYKATLLQDSGNTDGAIQAYNKVLTIDPNHKASQEKLLAMVKQQSDPAKLASGLKQYADRFPRNATIQAQIGEEFHQRKDLDNAIIFYQRALQADPNLASTWANLGAIYETQGREQESADAFQKAQSLEPDNPTFKELASHATTGIGYKAFQEAVSLQQAGKNQEALPLFRKALGITDTPEIRAAYGISLQAQGQLNEAIAEYQKAVAQDGNDPDYHYYLGTAYHQQKNLPKAEAAYKKALSLKPGYTEAQQALGGIEQQAASANLEKAVTAYNQKNYPTALTLVNQALSKNNQEPMAHYYKGLILDGQKKPSLAAQSYREAVKYNPDFTDAYYALGVALDGSKDANGARSAFEKFLNLSSGNEDDFVKYARDRLQSMAE